jgi:hypothetical protein
VNPPNYRKQVFDGCMNCVHRFDEYDSFCYRTIESVEMDYDRSFLDMYPVHETGICDDWEKT